MAAFSSKITVGAGSRQIVAIATAATATYVSATQTDVSLTVGGASPDMVFVVNWPNLPAGLILGGAWCVVAGTVKLRVYNPTGSDITTTWAENVKVVAI